MLIALDEELAEAAPYWSSALTGRDLLNWVRLNAHLNKILAKPYNPNCFAQQFGLIQGVPAPYQSVVGLEDRPSLLFLEVD